MESSEASDCSKFCRISQRYRRTNATGSWPRKSIRATESATSLVHPHRGTQCAFVCVRYSYLPCRWLCVRDEGLASLCLDLIRINGAYRLGRGGEKSCRERGRAIQMAVVISHCLILLQQPQKTIRPEHSSYNTITSLHRLVCLPFALAAHTHTHGCTLPIFLTSTR